MDKNWDLLISGALIFDGAGGRPAVGDVAIKDGRVVARGRGLDATQAARTIDAAGLWLTPGLLDIHTHYDLEVELVPGLPESVRHGTTSVVASNCSLGLAFGSLRDEQGHDPIVDCFARVENVPKHVLKQVADKVTWENPAGYLDHLRELPLGPNLAPMIPHSMLRIEVMGFDESIRRDATGAELGRMCELLEEGMRLGYVGFSTDAIPFHYLANDPNRRTKIPGQHSSFDEIRRLTDVVRRHDRVWQATPPKDDPLDVLRLFLLSSGRLYGKPLKLTAVAALDLVTNRSLLKMGGLLTDILNSKLLDGHFALQSLAAPFKTWAEGPLTPLSEEIGPLRRLNEPDLEDRAARRRILDDPQWVESFKKMWWHGKRGFDLSRLARILRVEKIAFGRRLSDMTIDRCPVSAWSGESLDGIYARLQRWQKTGEGARDEGERAAFEACPRPVGDEADFFIHLLKAYDTELIWVTVSANADPEVVKQLVFDDRFLPGFSDSGAHLTNMAFYDVNLRALKMAAEVSLDKVAWLVRRLTRDPADFFGLDVGTIEIGAQADITLIDPDKLRAYDGEANTERIYREDFGHEQLVNRSDGVVPWTIIAGQIAWEGERFSAELGQTRMGRLLTARQ